MWCRLHVSPSPIRKMPGLPWLAIMSGWVGLQSIVMCNQLQSIMQRSITHSWILTLPSRVFGCVHTCIQTIYEQLTRLLFSCQVWTKPENSSFWWMICTDTVLLPFLELATILWDNSLSCFPFGSTWTLFDTLCLFWLRTPRILLW